VDAHPGTAGQQFDLAESRFQQAAADARGKVPQGVKDTASMASTPEGRSQLKKNTKDTLAKATDFTIPQERIDELADRFRVLMVDGFGSRPEFKKGWEELMAILSDDSTKTTNVQGPASEVWAQWTMGAEDDVARASQGWLADALVGFHS
jgi:hypothetical protein